MFSSALKVLEKIENIGYSAWIVGGAVRDLLLRNRISDIDICTDTPIDILEKMWKTYNIGNSKDFGIVVIRENGYDFEISRLRSDGRCSDGRRPDSVSFGVTLEDDLSRRDLRINAIAMDRLGNIIDPFQGKNDIETKILRTVGNPYERFEEDFLRMMRVVRFSSRLGFNIDKDVGKAIRRLSSNITQLSPERITEEIFKAASQSGERFAEYILLLDKFGILRHILPELKQLQYCKEDLSHHPETIGRGGSSFAHTIEALKVSESKNPLVNTSILLHDIGKGVTFSDVEPGKTYTYYRHEKEGENIINGITERLKMSNEVRNTLVFTAVNHMKFTKLLDMKPSKIFRLTSDENWDILVEVGIADEFSRGERFIDRSKFKDRLEKAQEVKRKWEERVVSGRIKLVDGNHVMKLLDIRPGPKVGEVIRKTTDWILDNNIQSQNEIDKYIRNEFNV